MSRLKDNLSFDSLSPPLVQLFLLSFQHFQKEQRPYGLSQYLLVPITSRSAPLPPYLLQ